MANVKLWNRLEVRARAEKFEGNMRNAFHDPMWTLCRQWQTGEFEGSDNGSPVMVKLKWEESALKRISLQGNIPFDLPRHRPLEAEVERVAIDPDVTLRLEMGRHWERMLRKAIPDAADAFLDKYRQLEALQFAMPEEGTDEQQVDNARLLSNRPFMQWLQAATTTGALDGASLYQLLRDGQTASQIIAENNAQLDDTGNEFVSWFEEQYNQPKDETVDGWLPERMEYQFAISAALQSDNVVGLGAEEFYEGRLDWYSFTFGAGKPNPNLLRGAGDLPIPGSLYMIPTVIEYPGMPAARWWELEDYALNLLAIEASSTQSARLSLVEFGLMFDNDWFVMPLRLPVGALYRFSRIEVTDVFGEKTLIEHYKKANPSNAWSLFDLSMISGPSQQEDLLFLPPVLLDFQESKPVEEVNMLRDEMANMVWGVERRVKDGLGLGREGQVASQDVDAFLRAISDRITGGTPPVPAENEAGIRYELVTQVPDYWIPFIPVKVDDSSSDIRLQRAAMPRILPGLEPRRIRPRTTLLRPGLDESPRQHFFVFEEEVPKSGAVIRRTWQRARWHDGHVALWQGFHKSNGRGQGASGLSYDNIPVKE